MSAVPAAGNGRGTHHESVPAQPYLVELLDAGAEAEAEALDPNGGALVGLLLFIGDALDGLEVLLKTGASAPGGSYTASDARLAASLN